jgi:peptidyl-Lys metalloendopeptidase
MAQQQERQGSSGFNWFLPAAVAIALTAPPAFADEPPCSSDDTATAQAVMSRTKDMLDNAIAAIDTMDDATKARLATWFGVQQPDGIAKVRQTLSASRVYADGTTYLCAVRSDAKLGDYYAYVSPDKSFVITLGYFFFNAPESGFSSKPGVLVHELSHFTLAGATQDPDIYGPDAAKSIALSNPEKAISNAENIEYFVESTAFDL